jgi:hypothetical protein
MINVVGWLSKVKFLVTIESRPGLIASSERLPSGSSGPWQSMQYLVSSGATLLRKPSVSGRGTSCAGSGSAIVNQRIAACWHFIADDPVATHWTILVGGRGVHHCRMFTAAGTRTPYYMVNLVRLPRWRATRSARRLPSKKSRCCVFSCTASTWKVAGNFAAQKILLFGFGAVSPPSRFSQVLV